MKRLFLFFLLIGYWSVVRASDTVFIKEAQVPILIERQDNLLFYLRFDARDSRMLDGVTVDLSRCKNLDDIQSVKLYYGGTEPVRRRIMKSGLLRLVIFRVSVPVRHCRHILLIR